MQTCMFSVRRYATASARSHAVLHLNEGTWRSREELLDILHKSTVHESAQLIAVNKPVGLSVFGASRFTPSTKDENRDAVRMLSLRNMLSELQTGLRDAGQLQVVAALEREFSGVTLLAKSERAHRELVNFYKRTIPSVPQQLGFDTVLASTYLVVVRDAQVADLVAPQRIALERIDLHAEIASHSSQINKVSAKESRSRTPTAQPRLQPDEPVNKQLLTIAVDPNLVTKSLCKRFGTLHRPFVAHKVLCRNETLGCALLAVRMSSTKWHALEAYLVTQRARILGESFYSRRIAYVSGVAQFVPLATAFRTGYGALEIERPLRQALSLDNSVRMHQLPTFVHRYRLVVPRLSYAYTDLNGKVRGKPSATRYDTLVAELPQHFVFALDRLGLKFDPHDLQQTDAAVQSVESIDCAKQC